MRWTLPNILTVIRLVAAPCVALSFVVFVRPTADWVALALFVAASVTDWVDGYLARKWQQTSRFGAMLDPIADKAMVIIAVALVMATSGLNPLIVVPAAVILLREVFVSGLREFLGADAGRLQVTQLAKWKTAAQMTAITFLMLALGLEEQHYWMSRALTDEAYRAAMAGFGASALWWVAWGWWLAALAGTCLFWVAGLLTALTGWDYFRKALPFLQEDGAQ